MTADQLFSILNLMTMAAWLPPVFLPRMRWTATLLPVVMPLLLAVIYVALVAATLARSEGEFSSLAGVSALFDSPWALLAGWTHYLAFDLFIGGWEVRDAQWRGIPHVLVVPALVLTCLFGPAGLLLYLVIRWWAPYSGGEPPPIADPRALAPRLRRARVLGLDEPFGGHPAWLLLTRRALKGAPVDRLRHRMDCLEPRADGRVRYGGSSAHPCAPSLT